MKETSVLLARVSSKAQEDEGYSLDSQVKLLTEYCSVRSLVQSRIFRIAETASKDEERRTFQEMMGYLQKNKVTHLVVEKTDRLTRNFKDAVAIDEWLEANEARRVHFVKENYQLHKYAKSHEKFLWSIRVAMAKNYTDNLREEVRKGQLEKLAQGWYPGPPPIGYMTVGQAGKKIHVPNPDTAPLIKTMFELYLFPEYSLNKLTEQMEKLGLKSKFGRPLSRSHVQKLLSNPFYIGANRWVDKEYPGLQEPIIDKATFNAVQKKMTRPNAPKYNIHNPLFKNMFVCDLCKGTITWEQQRGHWYGKCNGYKGCPKQKYAREDHIEEQIKTLLDTLMCPSSAVIEWVQDQLKKRHIRDIAGKQAVAKQLQLELQKIERQKRILYEDRLSERIDIAQYERINKSLEFRESAVKNRLSEADNIAEKQFKQGMEVLDISQNVAFRYSSLPVDRKRVVISKLLSNMALYDGQPLLELTDLAKRIQHKSEISKQFLEHFRTSKNDPNNRGRMELDSSLRSIWLGLESDFRTISVDATEVNDKIGGVLV